jgi:hypothetical protein
MNVSNTAPRRQSSSGTSFTDSDARQQPAALPPSASSNPQPSSAQAARTADATARNRLIGNVALSGPRALSPIKGNADAHDALRARNHERQLVAWESAVPRRERDGRRETVERIRHVVEGNKDQVQTIYISPAHESAKDKARTLASPTEVQGGVEKEPYILIDTKLPQTQPALYREYLEHCVENIDTILGNALPPPPLQIKDAGLGDGVKLHIQNPPDTVLGTHKYYLGLNTLRIYREQITEMLKQPNSNLKDLTPASEYTSGNAASANAYLLSLANLPNLLATFGQDVTDKMVKNMEEMGAICTSAPIVNDGNWVPVLESSCNPNGVDIDELHENFPVSAYEQFLENVQTINGNTYPDMIVLPMGTGQLLKNLLDKLGKELKDPTSRPKDFKPIVLAATWAPPGQYLINKISGESTETRKKMQITIDELMENGVLHNRSGFVQVSNDDGAQGRDFGKSVLGITSEPAAGTATTALRNLFEDSEIKAYSKKPLLIHTGQGNHQDDDPFPKQDFNRSETWSRKADKSQLEEV